MRSTSGSLLNRPNQGLGCKATISPIVPHKYNSTIFVVLGARARWCKNGAAGSAAYAGQRTKNQVRLCRERAAREGWEVVQLYADAALSGASLMRPGIRS